MMSTHAGSLSRAEAVELHEKNLLRDARRWGYLPVLAGGVTSYPDPVSNPLTAPTVSGTSVTVDVLLNNPTIIRREVADKVMANFFLDKVFDMGGEVTGGAALYEQATTIDVYTDRDVERMQPGTEAPILTGARIAPLVQPVEKFGGKFPVTDEAKRRNDSRVVARQIRRMANTLTRKMQQRGIAELEAAISAFSRTTSSPATWKAAYEESVLERKPKNSPTTVLYKALEAMELLEMGYVFDTLIINPADAFFIRSFYGEQGKAAAAFQDMGITNLIVTPRKAAKSAILTAGKQVGEMRLEEPMRTETEREGAPLMRQQTWVQTTVNPLFIVTDPYAALEITGLS